MKFNEFFDFLSDLSNEDTDNYNTAIVKCIDDMDFGPCFSYSLDGAQVTEESYLQMIEELLDDFGVKEYRIEDNNLLLKLI